MAAQLLENIAYFDSNGLPLVDGLVYIGKSGLEPIGNLVTIYADSDFQTTINNPQTLNSLGIAENKIYIDGGHSLRVENSLGVQHTLDLNAGREITSGISPLINVEGTDTITANDSTGITSYIDKQIYSFTGVNINPGAMTLNIDNVGARDLVTAAFSSVGAGDVQISTIVNAQYNKEEDRFEWTNGPTDAALTVKMWGGTIATIPNGWVHLDGTNGTYDLRNKFPRGSNTDTGTADNPGDTGGTDDPTEHTLLVSEMPAHEHGYNDRTSTTTLDSGAVSPINVGTTATTTDSTGGGGPHKHGDDGDNIPAYVSIVFMMKL